MKAEIRDIYVDICTYTCNQCCRYNIFFVYKVKECKKDAKMNIKCCLLATVL